MTSQILIDDLRRKIALGNKSLEYAKLVYKTTQKNDYPFSTLIETDEITPYIASKNGIIKDISTVQTVDETLLLEDNLSNVLSPKDAFTASTSPLLSEEQKTTLNQFFHKFLQSIAKVNFKTVDALVTYALAFCDKINNTVNVKGLMPSTSEEINLSTIADDISKLKDMSEIIDYFSDTSNLDETSLNKHNVTLLYNAILDKIPDNAKYRFQEHIDGIIKMYLGKRYSSDIIIPDNLSVDSYNRICTAMLDFVKMVEPQYRDAPPEDMSQGAMMLDDVAEEAETVNLSYFAGLLAKMSDADAISALLKANTNFDVKSFNKTNTLKLYKALLKHMPEDYKELFVSSVAEQGTELSPENKLPIPMGLTTDNYLKICKDMVEIYQRAVTKGGKGLKLKKKKAVKYGKGLAGKRASDSYVSGIYYVDVGKLNSNILSIKYVKTGNKKFEIAVAEPTKMVVLQMILGKFSFSTYDKLTEKEKTVIAFINNILDLVEPSSLPNPIDELYMKFNILRGEIEAGNDNPLIKTELKQMAFQLNKFKKLNSSQLRNIVFELDRT